MVETAHCRSLDKPCSAGGSHNQIFQQRRSVAIEAIANQLGPIWHSFQLQIEADRFGSRSLFRLFARPVSQFARIRRREREQVSERGRSVRVDPVLLGEETCQWSNVIG